VVRVQTGRDSFKCVLQLARGRQSNVEIIIAYARWHEFHRGRKKLEGRLGSRRCYRVLVNWWFFRFVF
jgi:hypothetical protein